MNTVRKDRSSTHNGEEENEGDRDQTIKARFLIGSHVFLWKRQNPPEAGVVSRTFLTYATR